MGTSSPPSVRLTRWSREGTGETGVGHFKLDGWNDYGFFVEVLTALIGFIFEDQV